MHTLSRLRLTLGKFSIKVTLKIPQKNKSYLTLPNPERLESGQEEGGRDGAIASSYLYHLYLLRIIQII